jgi:PAS domain S-box-containing protein
MDSDDEATNHAQLIRALDEARARIAELERTVDASRELVRRLPGVVAGTDASVSDPIVEILNASGDPIFVKDDAFRFVFVNDALCEMLGMVRENILGHTLGESLPRDQMDHFLEVDRMVLESGRENLCEEPLTGRDGKRLTIVTRKTRYIDRHGSRFVVGVIRDITDRKLAEEKLKKSERELR